MWISARLTGRDGGWQLTLDSESERVELAWPAPAAIRAQLLAWLGAPARSDAPGAVEPVRVAMFAPPALLRALRDLFADWLAAGRVALAIDEPPAVASDETAPEPSPALEEDPGDEGKPRGEAGKPRGEAGKPRGDEGKPRGDEGKPRGDEGKPRGDEGKPRGEAGKPRGEAGAPRGDGGGTWGGSLGHSTAPPRDRYPGAGTPYREPGSHPPTRMTPPPPPHGPRERHDVPQPRDTPPPSGPQGRPASAKDDDAPVELGGAQGDHTPLELGGDEDDDAPAERGGFERAPEPAGRRAVDITLHRLEAGAADAAAVPPTRQLAAGQRYGVRVQIGGRRRGSLFTVLPPAIESLLPPSHEGHELEVALFPLDFTLRTASVQPLQLPRSGASTTATFEIIAPAAWGPARFRVVVTHRDRTLQAFVVTTQIGPREREQSARVLHATLERAATARFANLDALRPRAATAIVNDDPAGSHTLVLKRGDVTGTFTFGDVQIRTAASAVRRVLEDAAQSQRFDEPPPTTGSAPYAARVTAYHDTIRRLAALGASLRFALFDTADPGGKTILRDLARSADQVVELIHVARSLVIPWATIYDGWVPHDLNVVQLEVCDGTQPDGSACGHTGREHLLCVRRFWGLRHDLELVLGAPSARDAVTSLRRPGDRPPLRMIHGRTLQDATFMPDDYVRLLYQPGVPVWEHDVYTLLEEDRRPAVLVALGHFSLGAPVAGAVVHSIDLVPSPLTNIGVSQQTLDLGDWIFPHSIVLLMACSSGVAAADALTGMIDAFGSAGASAIIGTESTVFPRLSARAACSIYEHLGQPGGSLSSALRALRWELARGASPLGFSFTAYGNADLTMGEAT